MKVQLENVKTELESVQGKLETIAIQVRILEMEFVQLLYLNP